MRPHLGNTGCVSAPGEIEILRRAGPLTLCAAFAPTQFALTELLSASEFEQATVVVSDLSLGAWQTHQAAREFLAQLGVGDDCFPAPAQAIMELNPAERDDRGRDADALGKWIDDESAGDARVLCTLHRARQILRCISGAGPHALVLVMPRFGMPWRVENTALIQFLACGLQNSDSRLLLVCADEQFTQPPKHWQLQWLSACANEVADQVSPPPNLAALVPGVIEAGLAAVLDAEKRPHGLRLTEGTLLVPPEWRRNPAARLRSEYDRLGAIAGLPESLRAFAHLHGNVYYRDAGLLCREAWRQFCQGSYEIAKDYLEGAMLVTSDKEQGARMLLDLQGMRIAAQRFEEASAIEEPAEGLPTSVRGPLFQTKGWALTMLGNAPEGRRCLASALAILSPEIEGNRRLLYLKNIYALSLLKSGDPEAALRLEREIAADLDRHALEEGRRDWQLTYVNAINLARLYRILGDPGRAIEYYNLAFDTTLGFRSESDLVYWNVCLARVLGDTHDAAGAFACWWRAGVHWVSAESPEALAPRVVHSIAHRRIPSGEPCVETVSAALKTAILDAARAAEMPIDPTPASSGIPFRRRWPATGYPSGRETFVATPWGAVIAAPYPRETVYDGPETRALRNFLSSLVRAAAPELDWSSIRSLLVDDAMGREMPIAFADIAAAALRCGVERVLYNDRLLSLPAMCRQRLESQLSLKIGPAVSAVHRLSNGDALIEFKRYAPAIRVTAPDSLLLFASANITLEELGRARSLEAARVLVLDLDPQVLAEEDLPGGTLQAGKQMPVELAVPLEA